MIGARTIRTRNATLHGREVKFVEAGTGPVLLLVHGIAGSFESWQSVVRSLAREHTVIAPDLPGHGASEPSGGDYSLAALAAGLRDLLFTLGHDRATLVGHSLGGGVAMQFAYHFPEATERLVLVSSGGLGPEVSPVLRAATLPGAELFIAATAAPARIATTALARGLGVLGLRASTDLSEVARAYASLADARRRAAFLATLRGVVGADGQMVAASDRLYLAEGLPTLIVWGERDPIIPVAHAHEAHRLIAGSRLELFEGVGHIPQLEAPERFAEVLTDFLSEARPAAWSTKQWRARLAGGAGGSRAAGTAARAGGARR